MLVLVGSAQAQLYWRADLGFSFSNRAGLRDRNFAADGVICADPTCTSPGKINDAGDSPVLSAGLGWRFNRNFRADATLAYRGGYREQRTMPDGTEVKAHIKSWNLMANAYYEVPFTWGSPYVGAGLGFASNRIDKIAGTLQAPGGTQSGAAWALMAGASVPISSTYLEALEFGYRYIDLGKLQTDPGRLSGGLTPTYSGAAGRLKAHELMLGWRWRF
jgi:opacity protein-like surface antigen